MKYSKILLASSFVLVTICISACKKNKKDEQTIEPDLTGDIYATQKQQTKTTYANMAFALYDDAYLGTLSLKSAINTFVANPSEAGFQTCKQKWLDVREVYGLTEAFRFADGPIDNEADGPEGLINAWPMDEAYVDYVNGNPNSGIINNTASYPTINTAALISANENGGETNISLGFHAIEFLLWGQDTLAANAGQRPYTDYLTIGGTAQNQQRRGQYLNTTIDILISGLKQVRDAWDPAIANNYRPTFLGLDNKLALRKMFNSMKVMSGFELSGERMYTAYQNQDQEDEHSCFSDNTHRDIFLNAKGLENLYKGTYTRTNGSNVSGYALKDLIALYSAEKNNDVLNYLSSSLNKISLMYIPFDQAIVLPNERPKVLTAVQELQTLEQKVLAAASTLEIVF
jgi:putative iron-regulated protein